MPFQSSQRYDFWHTKWKEVGAVYGILSAEGGIIYIGQTDNLKERMTDHRGNSAHCMHRYLPTWVVVEVIEGEASRLWRERHLIQHFNPLCNEV